MTAYPTHRLRSRTRARFAALAALALVVSIPTGSAVASPGSGKVTLSLSSKNGGSSLLRQGVKVAYSAKTGKSGAAKNAPRKGGKGKGPGGSAKAVTLPVTDLTLAESATVRTAGLLKLSLGKRQALLRQVTLRSGGGQTAIVAKLGKGSLVVFRASAGAVADASSLSLSGAPLSLTGKAARALRKRLGLDSLTAGRLGALSVNARLAAIGNLVKPEQPGEEQPQGPADLDPYFQQCAVSASSTVEGSLPDAADLPAPAEPKATTEPGALTWGFRSQFRGYIVFVAGGSIHALDGATANGGPPVVSGFDFPVAAGEYASNDPVDMTDDQAVIEGSGKALFCGTEHGFRVTISNPTVVIDGEDSRIVADVDTNLDGTWTPDQRIDLAKLDLTGIAPFYNHSGAEVSWGQVPAALTQVGADAICGGAEVEDCDYGEGTPLDPIEVAVKTPYDASDLDALAAYVEANLPFPLKDPTQGGCTLPIGSLSGSLAPYKTIDSIQALHANPAGQPTWLPDAGRPEPAPDLSGATEVTGGGFDWGFRRSLRTSLNGSGEFNLAGGATASHAYFGNGGSGTKSMGDPGKFFTWPAQSSAGFYEAGASPKDARLVLRTAGRVAFCQSNTGQAYTTVFSSPTVVIDGEDSRIVVDVATSYRLSWVRGRVEIATLDLSDPTVTVVETTGGGTTTVEWKFPAADETVNPNVGPVELTPDGEAAVNMLSRTGYLAGLGLDGVAVRASFPAEEE